MKEKVVGFIIGFSSFWAISVVVLFFLYCGLYVMGFQPITPWKYLFGVAVIAVAFALLLQIDRQAHGSSKEIHSLTVWGLIHEMFVQRKSLLAFLTLFIVAIILGTYYISTSVFSVEYTPEAGVLFRLRGDTIYYVPISPYEEAEDVGGWQNTEIPLKEDEFYTVEISGSVSPGALQNIDAFQDYTRKVVAWRAGGKKGPEPPRPETVWAFTGPEGYDPDWYPPHGKNRKAYIPFPYDQDPDLTIRGATHNQVFGIILPPDKRPHGSGGEQGRPSYDWNKAEDREVLINLSCRDYPRTYQAKASGYLWVVINDADGFRWDNTGFFFLKLTRHSRVFKGLESTSEPCKH
jgi:hypothetical protein